MDSGALSDKLEAMSRIGDVHLKRVNGGDFWRCCWTVNNVVAEGMSFCPSGAVEDALEVMRKKQERAQRVRERSCNVHAYLYNPSRILR